MASSRHVPIARQPRLKAIAPQSARCCGRIRATSPAKLLNGGYNAGRKLDEITVLVKNDAQARRGWKAAVAEVLTDKVQGSRNIGETPEIQFARLAKEFKDNEALLSKTFSPEEMNGLRQAHTILGYFKEAEKRATVGSDTAEKWSVPAWGSWLSGTSRETLPAAA